VDLAGGLLDIWPLYLFHPGAVTVSVAIDRRAWCRVETGVEGVEIESKDALGKASGRSLSEILKKDAPSLAALVLRAFGAETAVRVVTQSRVPPGSGLGGSGALAVALAAAVAHALGQKVDPDGLWRIARDAETRTMGRPAGVLDYHTALRGGAVALHLEAGGVRVEPMAVDPARVEESLLLVDAGGTRSPGLSPWDVFKGQIDGDARVQEALAAIAHVAGRVREALLAGRFDDVVDLLAEEWDARKRLAPGVSTPEIDRVAEVAREAGGAAKVCGAGGGGVVAVWAPPGAREPGRREAVRASLLAAGFRIFPARVDLRGLEVE
jgi:D-glycero-alpha-D-manno-heptose-7-phosphate kinase